MSCPICARDSEPKYRPFCSSRCADIDLGRWLGERYVVPGNSAEDAETEEETAAPQRPS